MNGNFRALLVIAALGATVLAGCADKAPKKTDDTFEPAFEELDLKATDSTGVLRGVIIDEAIRPLGDVVVAIVGTTDGGAMTTADDGAFGFDGLSPGSYFITASKAGYGVQQSSGEVAAGVDEPDLVKILLIADPSQGPRVVEDVYTGFMECSVRPMIIAADCGQFVPGSPPGGQGIAKNYEFDLAPDWIQSELVWKSTQASGDELSLAVQCIDGDAACPNGQVNVNSSEGRSPLYVTVDRAGSERWMYGQGEPYRLRVFTYGRSDLDVYNEQQINGTLNSTTGGQVDCVHWPVYFDPATCVRATGPGFVINQAFEIYSHFFYQFTPKENWRFSVDGPHDVPAPK